MRVADEQPAVEVDLDAERTTAGVRDPVDVLAVVTDPEDAAVLGPREDRALVRAGSPDDDVLCSWTGDRDDLEMTHQASMSRYAEESRNSGTATVADVVRSRPLAVAGSTKTI